METFFFFTLQMLQASAVQGLSRHATEEFFKQLKGGREIF